VRRMLTILSLTVLSLLVAVPALAAGAVPVLAADESSPVTGDQGLWTGMIYAVVAGLIMGLLVILDSYAGAPADEDHDDHH
jgi:membrane protease YdiL (CAAX protease family)